MAPCPRCATENRPGAPFCVECGTGLAAATEARDEATVLHTPPALAATTVLDDEAPPVASTGGGGRPVLTVLAVLLAIVAVGVAAYLVGNEAADDEATTSSTSTSTTTTTTAAPPETEATGTSEPGLGPVDELPAGLSCRELADRGYSYTAAATYWFEQGQPAELDADGDGYPCGTVYPAEDVEAYWADR